MSEIGLVQIIEGALLAADKPLSVVHLVALFEEHEQPETVAIREALVEIGERCDGRGFELQEVASGFRYQVRQSLSPWVARLWVERPQRYSRALLETLALVAYRQPITRGEIEEIRGVAVSSNIVKTLQEREWIRIVGHRDVPGRPAMYATTRQFLDYFSLKSLDQLPALAEIRDLETLTAELGFTDLVVDAANETTDAGPVPDLAVVGGTDHTPESDTQQGEEGETQDLLTDDDSSAQDSLDLDPPAADLAPVEPTADGLLDAADHEAGNEAGDERIDIEGDASTVDDVADTVEGEREDLSGDTDLDDIAAPAETPLRFAADADDPDPYA